jgi:outer membrane protein OmpA-like peptidoglycan-associated protein/Tol biopolymer transport system component
MIYKNILLGISLIAFVCTCAFSQNVEFDKDNFKNDKEGFKEASRAIKDGDTYYEVGAKGTFKLALDKYLIAQKFNPNNALLNYKVGVCYLYSGIGTSQCLQYFQTAQKLNPAVADDIIFMLGRGYHLNLKFDEAIKEYSKYKNSLAPKVLQERRKELDKYIEECNNGKELIKKPVRVWIDNLGPSINSQYPDYSPLISADESMLIFTSRRDNTTGGGVDQGDQHYYEDIYVSYNNTGEWEPAANMGKPLNTDRNDATVGLSSDGQELFIFMEGDLFKCTLKGIEWGDPKAMSKAINSDAREADASFSYNGKTMYFASERTENTTGGFDIFVAFKNEKGKWDDVINIGGAINTEYDDRCVFMHPDGRTIYFSSQGHKTMGGFDIFKCTLNDDGTWSEPENLGYPINTPDDDLFFVLSASGKHGYYSSAKEGGQGHQDIYMITFRGEEKPGMLSNEDNLIASAENPISDVIIEQTVEIKTMRLTILKGTVKDAITTNPIEASIEIVDNEKNEVISTFTSNSATGKFLVSLPSGKNYGIAVKAEGYLFHSENFIIPQATGYQEVNKDILLNKMQVGSKIILKNIFFDYAKATLRSESSAELDRLVGVLTEYPNIKIEISGHTDNQGSLQLNTKLSESRAKSVVDYLISKGISAGRLTFKGYAFSQPIATNDTEEGRQENRRVEFKVLSN